MNITLSFTKTRSDALIKSNEYLTTFSNCTFRYPTDICTPTIRLTVNSLIININNVDYNISTDFNYVYIDDLNKYYFIQNVSIISNNVVDIYLQEDFISSFRTNIRQLSCIVTRNENEYDKFILDDKCSFKNTLNIEYITPTNTMGSTKVINNSNACVLMTIYATRKAWNDSGWLNALAFGMPTYTDNVSVGPNKTLTPQNCYRNEYNSTYTLVLSSLEYQYMMGFLATSSTLLTYVKNVRVLPISASSIGYKGAQYASQVQSNSVPIGDRVINFNDEVGMPQDYLRLLYSPFFVFNEFAFDFDAMVASSSVGSYVGVHDWLLRKPNTVFKIFLPYYGYVELNYEYCKGETIKVYYYIEPEIDDDYIMIIRSSDNKIIFKDSLQIAMDVPLNYDNTYENKVLKQDAQNTLTQQNNVSVITAFLGIAQTVVGGALIATGVAAGAGVGLVASGVGTFASGVTSGMQADTNFENTTNELFDVSQQRTGTGLGGRTDSDEVFVRIESYVPTDEFLTTKYAELIGRPLGKVKTLNSLIGYTVCSGFTLGFGNGQEKDSLTSLLTKGIYIN